MKYMHFRFACSFAGIANMLEEQGVSTEDTDIVKGSGLPYFLRYDADEKTYQAGPLLQGAAYYNLFLHPIGFTFVEKKAPQTELLKQLKRNDMFGIHTENENVHAVLFRERKGDQYILLNNRYEQSDAPDFFALSGQLLGRMDAEEYIGHIEKCAPRRAGIDRHLAESLTVWDAYRHSLTEYMIKPHSSTDLKSKMDPLFRPLFLDAITMMELIGEECFAESLKGMQRQYIDALKENAALRLSDRISLSEVDSAIQYIKELIFAALDQAKSDG